jgi:hypothetical protein
MHAPYGGGREWAAHLPDARLLTVRNAAHMLWLDAPGTVFPAIERFLKGAWPDAAARVPADRGLPTAAPDMPASRRTRRSAAPAATS